MSKQKPKAKFSLFSTLRMVILMCLPVSFYGLSYTGQYTWELSETGILVIVFSILDIISSIVLIAHWFLMRSKK